MIRAEKPAAKSFWFSLLGLVLSWWSAAYIAVVLVFGGFEFTFVYFYYWSLEWLPGRLVSWLATFTGPVALCFMFWSFYNQRRLKRLGPKPKMHIIAPMVLMIAAATAGTVPASAALILNAAFTGPSARSSGLRYLQNRLYKFELR